MSSNFPFYIKGFNDKEETKMETREELIQRFIRECGQDIIDDCEKQRGKKFFQDQWTEEEENEILYRVNEEGYFEEMTIEEAKDFRNKNNDVLKKSEIKDKITYEEFRRKGLKEFDIIKDVRFPFFDIFDQYKPRYVVAVPVENNTFRFIMITTGERTNIVYRRYEFAVEWDKENLVHESFARPNIIQNHDQVVFTKKSRVIGSFTENDINKLIQKRIEYRNERLIHPIGFLYWLFENDVKDTTAIDGSDDNNCNPIQTIEDIEKSKEANCVDIAIVTYKMAKKAKDIEDCTIGITTWIFSDKDIVSHIYMLFKYKSSIYVFNYDQKNQLGSFEIDYKNSFEEEAIEYSKNMKDNHSQKRVRGICKQVIDILKQDQLDDLENTEKYESQKEWLSLVCPSYKKWIASEAFYKFIGKHDPIFEAIMRYI